MPGGSSRSVRGWNVLPRRILAGFGFVLALWLVTIKARPESPPLANLTLVVDPNTAPATTLMALPRLGPALVGRIVEERERTPFVSLDDFNSRVRGIGPITMTSLRRHLRIDQPIKAGEPVKASPVGEMSPENLDP